MCPGVVRFFCVEICSLYAFFCTEKNSNDTNIKVCTGQVSAHGVNKPKYSVQVKSAYFFY